MAPTRALFSACVALGAPALGSAFCPGHQLGTPPAGHAPVPKIPQYQAGLDQLDVAEVMNDITALLTESQECWPADFGNYGPFFIRLAWHCSGTYRQSDGRGGCGGGRQRFEPEAKWADNENLDFARALLAPIKEQHGDGLSWGDLFILAGTSAIKSMGGPVSSVCVGRLDDPDGTTSLDLGPSPYQEQVAPCAINGTCELPLGTTTVGLIYVNPEGPAEQDGNGTWFQNPDPVKSAPQIREVFARMGMNDSETVALIGGGHAFGKTHGPCKEGPGKCGTGIGKDAFTSGFEGPWTTTPTAWGNEFFRYLLNKTWEKHLGPAGHYQFRLKAPSANEQTLMRLTTDMALVSDDNYTQIVKRFAASQSELDAAFAAAWYKLTHNGGMWAENKRCMTGTGAPVRATPAVDSDSKFLQSGAASSGLTAAALLTFGALL